MDYPTPESSDRTAPSLPSSVDEHPIITVSNQGKYRGGTDRFSYYKPIQQWLGIPYAYPPTGPLRFRPPKPLTSALIPDANLRIFDVWERWGAQCPASKLYKNQYAFENEDCLNLNIFRAANQLTNEGSKELLPVILYIHGGDFLTGNGRDSYNVGGLVASACLPVIGVSFNYRIGVFGFLSGSIAYSEGSQGGINAGLQDQRCAMEWVQRNIEAFGGDPKKVTAIGTGAGATSIGHHLNDLRSPPPFHRAILESGGSSSVSCYSYDHELHELHFREFVNLVRGQEPLPLGMTPQEKMTYLRSLPTDRIQGAGAVIFERYKMPPRWPWQPVIDKSMIPRAPIHSLGQEKWHKHVGILTGFNSNEASSWVINQGVKSNEDFRRWWSMLRPDFSEQDLDNLESLYPAPGPVAITPEFRFRRELPDPTMDPHTKRVEESYSDYAIISPVLITAKCYAEKGEQNTFLYEFAVKVSKEKGADYGSHIPFVTRSNMITKHNDMIWKSISVAMSTTWIAFAVKGNPNIAFTMTGDPDFDLYKRWWDRHSSYNGARAIFGQGNTEGWGRKEEGGNESGIVQRLENKARSAQRMNFWFEFASRRRHDYY